MSGPGGGQRPPGRVPAVDVRRAGDRYLSVEGGVRTAHSFSFGRHYDPSNTGFGLLLVHDEHALAPGSGFAPHLHRDVEVVTWVLSGALHHEDSTGRRGVLRHGTVQRMSAGSGVEHSEVAREEPVRFVQAWLTPDVPGARAQLELRTLPHAEGLVPALAVGRDAELLVGLFAAGAAAVLPEAPYVHLFVTAGAVEVEGAGRLGAGDAARVLGGGGTVSALGQGAEVLVWAMRRATGR